VLVGPWVCKHVIHCRATLLLRSWLCLGKLCDEIHSDVLYSFCWMAGIFYVMQKANYHYIMFCGAVKVNEICLCYASFCPVVALYRVVQKRVLNSCIGWHRKTFHMSNCSVMVFGMLHPLNILCRRSVKLQQYNCKTLFGPPCV